MTATAAYNFVSAAVRNERYHVAVALLLGLLFVAGCVANIA
jgi:hypothetical protein